VSGIIIYRGTYGSTKQYADWIHEETGFPVFDSRDSAIPWDTETVVIGCPVIANKPFLLGWIQRNWTRLDGKNVVLFTTSGADPAKKPVAEWIAKSLPEGLKAKIRVFPLAGRCDFSKMTGAHKLMLRIGAVVLRSEDIKRQMKIPVDGVARANLEPLLAHLRS